MPLPQFDRIGDWSSSQLQRFIQQAVLIDPPSLPRTLDLDALSVIGDIDMGGNFQAGGWIQGLQGLATTVGPNFPSNPQAGHIHLARVDVSPYAYEMMIFDATLQKWISMVPKYTTILPFTDPTSPVDPSWGYFPLASNTRLHIYQALSLYNLGLRPQVRLTIRTGGTHTGTHRYRVQIDGYDSGDTSLTNVANNVGTQSNSTGDFQSVATPSAFRFTGWLDRVFFSGQPTKGQWVISAGYHATAASKVEDIDQGIIEFRWVKDA